jgi:hypothetical protein
MGEAEVRTRYIVAIGPKAGDCQVCHARLATGGVELGLWCGQRIWICWPCASRAADVSEPSFIPDLPAPEKGS